MSDKLELIKALMQANLEQDDEKFLGFLTDDIVYHYHVGSRPLIGKEWVRKFLNKYREITADVNWRIERYAETDDELFVEGYEEYLDTRTNEMIAHPYMGIFEFRGGKIAAWRDYFEMDNKKVPDSDSSEALAVAGRFMAALNVADADTVRAIYAPEARIWHNFSDALQSVDDNIKSMHWMHSKLKNLNYDVQDRVEIHGGFVQQHILRGTLASGETFALHACAICKVKDGRITELREYLDTAQTRPLFK